MDSYFRTRRKELGLTVPEIAERVGVSDTAAWNWDRGKSLPKEEYVEKLAALLDVSSHTLNEQLVRIDPELTDLSSRVDRILDRARDDLASHLGVEVERVEINFLIKSRADT
ncbi:helix-turn-helix domain-containing protein [Pontixanthobacter aquaemixtae]|uniref:Helix-turn-helix domain-containing protein n=1 Tax=Pontixanthobacter aquaemixtae TaxID=1958940 RepID=A0A844ZT58_9SPHN|nr:helix-turn-helix transcriptional regulator [Pontixanthobacter aquaemixtae]MXO91501.1 helix-turn-helix domain-containing protein [Pontixanthobacter aquaemixtae]